MKTKALLFISLFLGIGLTRLSAQPPEIGKSGNWTMTFILEGFGENVPLNCNCNTIDVLVGTVKCHTIYHWSNFDGNLFDWDWVKQQFDGELTSQSTQEVFKVKDILKQEGPYFAGNPATGHFNVIGDQGTHYIINYIWDMNGMTFVSVKCPGEK